MDGSRAQRDADRLGGGRRSQYAKCGDARDTHNYDHDRDAEAFVTYLQSPAGGSLSDDNIRLLTNEKATGGKLVSELDWLRENSMEGDVAIIYFSGHGDVEKDLFGVLEFDSVFWPYMVNVLQKLSLQY